MPMITTIGSANLSVSDWGDPASPSVVFVHGWGLNGDMWSTQVPPLIEAGFRPVTYDQRGCGRSDRPAGGYDLDTLSDDLASVIDTLDLHRPVLVGHSLGAQIAIRYLTRHSSQQAAGLVLSAPATPMPRRADDNPYGADETAFEAHRTAMADDIGAFIDATSPADYFGTTKAISPTLADWTRRQIVDTPLHVLIETHKTFTRADLRAELANVDLPALILQGSADRSAPLEITGRPTAALLPRSRLVVFDEAGHGLYTSEAPRYNAEIIRFAQDLNASVPTPLTVSGLRVSRPRQR
jgi:non-heme chloroperoxidase